MSTTDAAKVIGVSVVTIRAWINVKKFKDVRRPSRNVILVSRQEVEELKNMSYLEYMEKKES